MSGRSERGLLPFPTTNALHLVNNGCRVFHDCWRRRRTVLSFAQGSTCSPNCSCYKQPPHQPVSLLGRWRNHYRPGRRRHLLGDLNRRRDGFDEGQVDLASHSRYRLTLELSSYGELVVAERLPFQRDLGLVFANHFGLVAPLVG